MELLRFCLLSNFLKTQTPRFFVLEIFIWIMELLLFLFSFHNFFYRIQAFFCCRDKVWNSDVHVFEHEHKNKQEHVILINMYVNMNIGMDMNKHMYMNIQSMWTGAVNVHIHLYVHT
jgi:hypothetical protein